MFSHGFFGSLLGRETWKGTFISCPVYTVCFKVGHLDVVIFDMALRHQRTFFFQPLLTPVPPDNTECTCLMSLREWILFYGSLFVVVIKQVLQ